MIDYYHADVKHYNTTPSSTDMNSFPTISTNNKNNDDERRLIPATGCDQFRVLRNKRKQNSAVVRSRYYKVRYLQLARSRFGKSQCPRTKKLNVRLVLHRYCYFYPTVVWKDAKDSKQQPNMDANDIVHIWVDAISHTASHRLANINWRTILDRPDLVRQRTPMGYPLHEACRMGLSFPVIRALVEQFPEAVTANASDSCWETPVFRACNRDRPNMDTLALLVKLDPGCLRGTADRPPLLHFCMGIPKEQERDFDPNLVNWVTSQLPQAADLPDFQGHYLAHYATASNDAPFFRKLLLQTPASGLVDTHGNHLLHVAVAGEASMEANVTCILEHCPTAVTFTNHRGELPAHVAVREEVRNLVLERYPLAMLQLTHTGASVLGNVRKMDVSFGYCYFPNVGEIIDGFGDDSDDDSDTSTGDARLDARQRRDEEDWEMPFLWDRPESLIILRRLDVLFNLIVHKVRPPLRRILQQSWHRETGNCLPSDILNAILRFAVPHYEEAVRHTPN